MLMSTEFKPVFLSVPSNFNSTTRNVISFYENIDSLQMSKIKKLRDVKLTLFDENNINKIFAEILIKDGELSSIDIAVKKINNQESEITYFLKDIQPKYSIQALNEYFGKVINKKSREYQKQKTENKDKNNEITLSSYQRENDFIFDIKRYENNLKAVQYSHTSFIRSSTTNNKMDKLVIDKIYSDIKYHQCKINREIIKRAIENLDFNDSVTLSAWYKIGINNNSKEFIRAVNKIKNCKKSNNNALYQKEYRNRKRSLYSLVDEIIIEQSR